MPVFIWATFQTIKYGSKRKPEYIITKKFHTHAWYWKETLLQKFIIGILSTSIIISLIFRNDNLLGTLPLIFWASYFIYAFAQVVKNSWHGLTTKYFQRFALGKYALLRNNYSKHISRLAVWAHRASSK